MRESTNLEALDLFDDVADVGRLQVVDGMSSLFDLVERLFGVRQPRGEVAESVVKQLPLLQRLVQLQAALLDLLADGRPSDAQRFQLLFHGGVRYKRTGDRWINYG